MNRLDLHPQHLAHREDWQGECAAFTCPRCEKVYMVSIAVHGGERQCPNCGKSTAFVKGSSDKGGSAWMQW